MQDKTRMPNAAQVWQRRWQEAGHRRKWQKPSREVLDIAAACRQRGFKTALDLGCGLGRHTVALARMGYEVTGLDPGPESLRQTRSALDQAGAEANLASGSMRHLPFAQASFDYALAVGVIMHGDGPAMGRALAELRRVVRPGRGAAGHFV